MLKPVDVLPLTKDQQKDLDGIEKEFDKFLRENFQTVVEEAIESKKCTWQYAERVLPSSGIVRQRFFKMYREAGWNLDYKPNVTDGVSQLEISVNVEKFKKQKQ